jgi:ligand-binding SRPBCC domain-containing protein
MTQIVLSTEIKAPSTICFDLSRSIDLHLYSTRQTNEKAIAGRTEGLIAKNEYVTWRAKHFGITQYMSTRIAEMERPELFVDEMISGPFKSLQHFHFFESHGSLTFMKDEFFYSVPYGIIGRIFNFLILKKYMKALLLKRNRIIKACAENGDWQFFLRY